MGDAYQYTLLPALAALWARLRHHPLALADCRNAWTAADPDHTLDLRIAFASGLLFMWPHFQNMNTSVNWDTLTLFRVPDAPFHDPWHLPPATWDHRFAVHTLARLIEVAHGLAPDMGLTAVTRQWASLMVQDSVALHHNGSLEVALRYVETAQGIRPHPFHSPHALHSSTYRL